MVKVVSTLLGSRQTGSYRLKQGCAYLVAACGAAKQPIIAGPFPHCLPACHPLQPRHLHAPVQVCDQSILCGSLNSPGSAMCGVFTHTHERTRHHHCLRRTRDLPHLKTPSRAAASSLLGGGLSGRLLEGWRALKSGSQRCLMQRENKRGARSKGVQKW